MRSTGMIAVALIVLTIIGVALAPIGAPALSGDDSGEFREFMEPRLLALYDSASTVNSMVSGKSRNILALRSESNRIEAITTEIDDWLADNTVPAWGEPVVEDYRAGVEKIDTAIGAAYDAISSFNFSRMADMIPVFDEGTGLIQQALDTLRESAGS